MGTAVAELELDVVAVGAGVFVGVDGDTVDNLASTRVLLLSSVGTSAATLSGVTCNCT